MVPRARQPVLAGSLALFLACAVAGTRVPAASAFDPLKPVCGVAGWISGVAGKACGVLQHGDKLLGAGKKLITGHAGGAGKRLLGGGGGDSAGSALGSKAAAMAGLAAVGAWVLGGAKAALHDTATVLDKTTRPQLTTTWFSSTYWRMAGIGALLTLPFVFAAAVQALMRSDLALLAKASLGYLPLSLLAVSVAAPVTMLLLAASDGISAIVSSAAGGAGTRFLAQLGLFSGTLSVLSRSPFVAFFIGLLTVSAAVLLWVELLMREAAVYIVVLMLPLAFASLVWPARRVWAIRVIELLVALILSKFAIVAVLALGGAALGQRGSGGIGGMVVGLVLVVLAAAAPWALVRLLPMTELASAAAGQFRGEGLRVGAMHGVVDSAAGGAGDWAGSVTAGMRRQAADTPEPAAQDDAPRGEVEKLRPANEGAAPAGQHVDEADAASEALGATAGMTTGVLVGAGVVAGSGTAAEPGAAPQTGAATPADQPTKDERLPGLAPKFQQEDGTWDAIGLGPEAFSTEPLRKLPGTADAGGTGDPGTQPNDPDSAPSPER